jgi:hypothetical protein
MMTFFGDGPASDADYCAIRDLPYGNPYREFTERLWTRFNPSPDPHFLRDARAHFHQRFWEMYLFCSLSERELGIRKGRREGPDFYFDIDGRRYWVEAMAPEPGNEKNRVPVPHLGRADYVPVDKILLRYTNALLIKLRKWEAWQRKGVVKDGDGYIIAINAGLIRDADLGRELPYFVHAFLPFGYLSVTVDRNSLNISQPYFPYCDTMINGNESPVCTAPLLDSRYSPISSIIHSFSRFTDHRAALGGDFAILRNPLARVPLPSTSFRWCKRYRFEDNRLLVQEVGPIPIEQEAL